jgi:catechol 2,3-dioxygenase-like lactoylglutathione lyase family enzyme
VLAAVAPPQLAHAQDAPRPAFAAAGAFMAFSVADLAASTKWYAQKLGMSVVLRPPPGNGVAVVVLEGGGLIVELLHNQAAVPLRTAAPAVSHTTLVHGVFKAGVVVDDFDRTVAMLRERGVDIAIGPFPARDGQRANVIVRDNSGNLIQFFGK